VNRAEQVDGCEWLWEVTCTGLFEFQFKVRIAQSCDHDHSGPPIVRVPESIYPVQKIKAVLPGHDEVQQYGMGAHLLYGPHSPSRFLAKGYGSAEVGKTSPDNRSYHWIIIHDYDLQGF